MLASCLIWCLCGATPLETASTHRQHGRYDEAAEILEPLAKKSADDFDVQRAWAKTLWDLGRRDEAAKILDAASQLEDAPSGLYAEKARQLFERGRYLEADAAVKAALKANGDDPLAHFIQAHLLAEQGDLKAATDGFRWFVRYYNRAQPTDAETLVLVARGAAQYARWQNVTQIFDFTVNTLCVDALKDDADNWEAHAVGGALLLEKYNEADGLPELKKALAINPRAVEVIVTLAESALHDLGYAQADKLLTEAAEDLSGHPDVLRLQAQSAALQGDLKTAAERLNQAVEANPLRQQTLALHAFLPALQGHEPTAADLDALFALAGQPAPPPGTAETIDARLAALFRTNPKPGVFLYELGRLFETQRKFALAEKCYLKAVEVMPQLSAPKTELGRLYFQTGRVDEAKKLLDAAFKADPFHVRVSNLRKVIRVLDGYATTTTPHFVIRADAQLDGVLARYMAEYLEEIYPVITERYGYEPPQRTQIEIYNKANGLGGHQWFSARMIGLPWIQTIGASTGMMIAMTSPSATDEPFNWARVLQHEFIHVVTLQETDFNIPHWYTEALATRAEGYPFPREWDRLLTERFATRNLRNLDNLHLGFQRAESRDDWNFAYCQSVYYSDYFEERFGDKALAKLLEAYRHTRSTETAVQEAFAVNKADLEAGYLKFLEERVARIKRLKGLDDVDPATVRKTYEAKPDDPDAAAAFAEWQLRQGKTDEALQLAAKVLKGSPDHLRATLVTARVHQQKKAWNTVEEKLTKLWQADTPQPQVTELLALAQLKQDDGAAALATFTAARQADPGDPRWWQGSLQAAQLTKNEAAIVTAAEKLSSLVADDPNTRKLLAQIGWKNGDAARTVRFAKQALQVDVLDAETHWLLARGLAKTGQRDTALAEYTVARQLQPNQPDREVEEAELLDQAGKKDEARKLLGEIRTKHPEHAGVKQLVERWKLP